MRRYTFLLVLAAVAVPAFAQFRGSGGCGPNASRPVEIDVPGARLQPVTGAPYSAIETSGSRQALADDTHIDNQSTREIATWRDSSGRVRTEYRYTGSDPDPWCDAGFAEIQDPVSGYTYLLDPKNQVAHRARLVAEQARSAGEVATGQPRVPRRETQTIEPLGEKTMLGLKVSGTRVTSAPQASRPSPSGPTVSETWVAPQLVLVVYRKTSNAVQGTESIEALKDLSTAEPDPSLLQVPAGFKMVDEEANRNGTFAFVVGGKSIPPPTPTPANVCETSLDYSQQSVQMRPVTGAPYSARESTVRTRALADGSQAPIPVSPSDRLIWRDSSGRERRETGERPGDGGCNLHLATILDPVAGYLYEIDPVNKIAHRVPLKPYPSVSAADLNVRADPARPAVPGTQSESLGAKTVSGVTVVGTRRTTVTPAGRIGNDRSLTSTLETWYSPSLALEVSSKTTSATRTTGRTLNDLRAGEPDPSLFRVPEGYKIVDEAGPFTIRAPRANQPVGSRQ